MSPRNCVQVIQIPPELLQKASDASNTLTVLSCEAKDAAKLGCPLSRSAEGVSVVAQEAAEAINVLLGWIHLENQYVLPKD